MHTTTARVVGPHDGKTGFLGSIGVRFMLDGDTRAIVLPWLSIRCRRMPLPPRFTVIARGRVQLRVEGRVGALLGEDVVLAGPGDLIFKPRAQWHTFWNAGDEPARLLEIISPAGFERFFAELVELGGVTEADPQVLAALCGKYELEMDPRACPT